MAQRLKGQDTVISFTGPGGDVSGLDSVLSFEAELDIEILEEGYLGETANRFDDIFNGVSGTVELHLQTTAYFKFTQDVQDRAQRRTPAGGVFNATSTFQFPNGQRARITFEDIFFGPMPLSSPSRKDYVKGTVQWKCSNLRRVL
jgi:hypothetical protein